MCLDLNYFEALDSFGSVNMVVLEKVTELPTKSTQMCFTSAKETVIEDIAGQS